jgi:hypothetical protein
MRKIIRKAALTIAALASAIALAGGISLLAPLAANAATVSVTGTTYLPANLDSGNGTAIVNGLQGGWAIDTFHRTLTVTSSDACTLDAPSASYSCYSATITDTGTFKTLPGNGRAPNPNSAADVGTNIAYPPVSGPFSGQDSYLFWADQVPAVANIANVVNNGGHVPALAIDSTSGWYAQAFPGGTNFADGFASGIEQNTWGWSYTSMTGAGKHTNAVACESWTDDALPLVGGNDSAGNQPGNGNITGKQCAGTPKPHYTRVPNCIGKRVYVCTQLLAGRGLNWSLDTARKPRTAYYVRSTKPAVGSVVLAGTIVKIQDVLKSGL